MRASPRDSDDDQGILGKYRKTLDFNPYGAGVGTTPGGKEFPEGEAVRRDYGRAVPDLDFTAVVSPLLRLPSVFTSERKLVASTV